MSSLLEIFSVARNGYSLVGSFLYKYPELLPLAVNISLATVAAVKGEMGKTVYWIGAAVLTVGILMMKG